MQTTTSTASASSHHDFDFLIGAWEIHNTKLKSRLTGCTEWSQFDFTSETKSILSGFGNLDESGNTLRLYNDRTGKWTIYGGFPGATALDVLEGFFEGPVGRFFGPDTYDGRPIICQFEWDKTDPDAPTWRQAFSVDDGQTWEWNWKMEFKRVPEK